MSRYTSIQYVTKAGKASGVIDLTAAQALADACLFPVEGKRSWGGGRGTEFKDQTVLDEKYGGKLGFAKWANENMDKMDNIYNKILGLLVSYSSLFKSSSSNS